MMALGLNQMTMPNAPLGVFMDVARAVGCNAIELRNDLGGALFDGLAPAEVREMAKARGLQIAGLAEVYGFNNGSEETLLKVRDLAELALALGAGGIALIPQIMDAPLSRDTQMKMLTDALEQIAPVLEATGVVGLIEPLGFANSSLRFKADVAAVLGGFGADHPFALIHDTFHHTLAGETEIFAPLTRCVHISGVVRRDLQVIDLQDADRGLVDGADRLGNLDQLRALAEQGYAGPITFEAFAPEIHSLEDPKAALSTSITFITDHGADKAA